MFSSLSNIKIIPTVSSNNSNNRKEAAIKQTHTEQNKEEQTNDIQSQSITDIIVDPYLLPFNIQSSFKFNINHEFCPFYIKGYNLLHDSRTSK